LATGSLVVLPRIASEGDDLLLPGNDFLSAMGRGDTPDITDFRGLLEGSLTSSLEAVEGLDDVLKEVTSREIVLEILSQHCSSRPVAATTMLR
jgi:hypothetical protein